MRELLHIALFFLISRSSSVGGNHTWDVLIFSQHWPITVCMEWEENKVANNCTLPPKEKLWTIHGIWPTKIGSKGPTFCNKSMAFQPEQLEPILPALELYWMNIEANTPLYALWQHEWLKHGTCAVELAAFDSQLSYFRQGLQWIQEYGMNNILANSGIEPQNGGYAVDDLFHSIRTALNRSAFIVCTVDKKSKISLLSEIRMCFDRSLAMIDCELVAENEGYYSEYYDEKILTNCNENKKVVYYEKVPASNSLKRRRTNYMDRLFNAYQFVQQIIWTTL